MPSDDFRRKRLIKACELFAGERWQSAVSRASGVPQSTLAMIVKGERLVTTKVEIAVFEGIRAAAAQLMTEYGEAADNAAIALLAVQQEN